MIFSACIFDSDRTPLGYSVIAIDNSEQVRAMQYLAEREIHCRYIAQLSPDVEWSATADGIFDYISPIADDVLDGTMRERIERWFARIHPDDFPEVHRRWFEDQTRRRLRVRVSGENRRWRLSQRTGVSVGGQRQRREYQEMVRCHEVALMEVGRNLDPITHSRYVDLRRQNRQPR